MITGVSSPYQIACERFHSMTPSTSLRHDPTALHMAQALFIAAAFMLTAPTQAAQTSKDMQGQTLSQRVPAPSNSVRATDIPRDQRGRIARSSKARNDFKAQTPCPATGRSKGSCPGHVIDHTVPLKRGGADEPSNMQWQTVAESKAKDRWE